MSETNHHDQGEHVCEHGNTPTSCRACRSDELRDEQLIVRILVDGSDEEMKELQTEHGLSEQKINWYRHQARLRNTAIEAVNTALARREQEAPELTPLERDMGIYVEQLEPQVRDATIALREKGYSTFISGFTANGNQQIGFTSESAIETFEPPVDLIQYLANMGIELIITPTQIKLDIQDSEATPTLEQWETAWNEVVASMPDLQKKAERSNVYLNAT